MNRVITLSLLGSLSLVAVTNTASAAITSATGSVFWHTSQPTSALPGALVTPVAHVWDEQQNVTVSGQAVNIASSFGSYTGSTPNFATVSGTFDSHFIHFDLASGVGVAGGFISFSSNIAAIIYNVDQFSFFLFFFAENGYTYMPNTSFTDPESGITVSTPDVSRGKRNIWGTSLSVFYNVTPSLSLVLGISTGVPMLKPNAKDYYNPFWVVNANNFTTGSFSIQYGF